MLLACINYNLSLGYMLTFFVFSVALGAMSRTHQNLVGLECSFTSITQKNDFCYVGDAAHVEFQLRNTARLDKRAITVGFKSGHGFSAHIDEHLTLSPSAGATSKGHLELRGLPRGLHAAPPLTIASTYPLGIWRAWSYVFHPGAQTHGIWIFPAPRTPLPNLLHLGASDSTNSVIAPLLGTQGDAVSHVEAAESAPARNIHWPSVAKGQLAQRVLEDQTLEANRVEFGFAGCTVQGLEAQLEQLCAGVLHCQAQGIAFTLKLNGLCIPASGEARCDAAHVLACLQALALHE